MDATVVKSPEVTAGDGQIGAADFNIRHLLGLDNGMANVFFGNLLVGDLTFANPAGTSLANSHDVESVICSQLTNDGTNL
jgi:hypothetical protein